MLRPCIQEDARSGKCSGIKERRRTLPPEVIQWKNSSRKEIDERFLLIFSSFTAEIWPLHATGSQAYHIFIQLFWKSMILLNTDQSGTSSAVPTVPGGASSCKKKVINVRRSMEGVCHLGQISYANESLWVALVDLLDLLLIPISTHNHPKSCRIQPEKYHFTWSEQNVLE